MTASQRGWQGLLVALLLTVAGCAEQTAPTAQAPPTTTSTAQTSATPPSPDKPAAAPAPSSAPVAAAPQAPAPAPGEAQRPAVSEFVEEPALKDVFFDAGRTEIGRQGAVTMKSNAGWLTEHADMAILIEGHTDWKGNRDANLAVGEKRAQAARDFLVKEGINETRIQIVSYGSDRPVCPQKTEACAAKNRRVHFLVKSQ